MKLFSFTCIIIFCWITSVNSKGVFTKTLIDHDSHTPIQGAHIYINNYLKIGTITNKDGLFVLNKLNESDIVCISHVSYVPIKQVVGSLKSDTIFLKKRMTNLDEIIVHRMTGVELLKCVIDSLESNHSIEPILYNTYVRSLMFEQDYSELHVLSEYDMNVYQKKDHNSEFRIIKTRASSFSNAGKKYFKDMRMIQAISINGDNIFRFRDNYLKKNKLKKFDIKITCQINSINNNYIELMCKPIKETYYNSAILLIDLSSYGIIKITKYYSDLKDEYKEVSFKQIEDKWYLQSSRRRIHSKLFEKGEESSNAVLLREVIYNIDSTQYDPMLYKTGLNLVAEPIKLHLGDWSDSFWSDHNYIPLPKWVKTKIE